MAQTAAQKARIDQLAQNRLASGASTKNTATGSTVMPGATATQLIAQAKTGVPAANQANILKMPTAPVTSPVAKPAPVTTTQPTPIKTTQTAVASPVTPTSQQATSYDDLAKAQIQQGYDETAKTGTDLGIKTYESIDQQFQDTIKRQREQKALQEQQLALQKSGNNQDAEENKKAISSAAEVQKSQLSDNREGFSSGSNQAASTQLQAAVQQKLARIEQGRLAANAAVESAQKDLDAAELAGNTELAGKYRAKLDLAKQQVQQAEDEHIKTQIALQDQQNATIKNLADTGALTGASPDQIKKLAQAYGIDEGTLQAISDTKSFAEASDAQKADFDRKNTALNTFKGLATEGVAIPNSLLLSMSESTGLPVEALMQFNDTSATIMANKTLSNEEKKLQVQELGMKLDRQQRGILNAELEKVDYLTNLYKSGASQEEINRAKSVMGIKDMDDPMYRADLAYKQAQANIEQKHANGEPVTPQDYSALADYQAKLAEYGIDTPGTAGGAYIPTKPIAGMQVNYSNGVLNVKTPVDANGKQIPFQCGAGVNRVWGLQSGGKDGMPSAYSGKQAIVNKRGIRSEDITDPDTQIVPGMAFVMPIGGKIQTTGHTGLVKQNLGGGKFLTAEWNWDLKGGYSEQVRSYTQMYGFAAPPSNSAQKISKTDTKGDVSSMSDADILSAYEKADKVFDTVSEQKKAIAAARSTGFLPSPKKGANGLTPEGDIPVDQRSKLQTDDSVKKIKSANNFNLALQAYEDLVKQTGDLERWGENKTKLDSAYANLKVQFKNAAELGAIAAADVPLIESSIKPMTKDFWDIAGQAQFGASGGKNGVLASLEEAKKLSNERKSQAVNELTSLYPEYSNTPYFKSIIGEDVKNQKEAPFWQKLIEAGKGQTILDDHHATTGQYAIPEDHPVNNYSF